MNHQQSPPTRRLDGLVARQPRIALIEEGRDDNAPTGRGVVDQLHAARPSERDGIVGERPAPEPPV